MKRTAAALSLFLIPYTVNPASTPATPPEHAEWRGWVEAMKSAPRGPFARIRWFCNDGTVLPPKPYACREHGGGHQHGEWTAQVKTLRANGFLVANVLAGADLERWTEEAPPPAADALNQILIEQFLVQADDGWILRKARYYRGALQAEDEAAGARNLLLKLVADPAWSKQGYLPLRLAARLLDHGVDSGSVVRVRQHSLALSEKDADFLTLRIKIHNKPEAGDAERVLEYARGVADPQLAAEYRGLADEIEQAYAVSAADQLTQLADRIQTPKALSRALRDGAGTLRSGSDPAQRYRVTSELLARLRDDLPRIPTAEHRLEALDASLALETENFIAATALMSSLPDTTRRDQLDWMAQATSAVYGVGLISPREYAAVEAAFRTVDGGRIPLERYKSALDYLARVPGWASQWMRYYFGTSMHRLAMIEPLANRFAQDQLRASPLFFYSAVLNNLARDANRLAGVRHRFFGQELGSGLRALNPGLSRGILYTRSGDRVEDFDPEGIYLLPETVADLPPVAGILTAGEGNPLSHVQLLARNLGLPNVAVDEALIPRLQPHHGKRVILAVSRQGQIEIEEDKGQLDTLFEQEAGEPQTLIRPDLDKLDLDTETFLPLERLRASDSGRTVGPKAAKLGELKHHYPEAVADGVAIPFGAFRTLLNQPKGDTTAFQWIVAEYDRLGALPKGSEERIRATESFRAELQEWVRHADPGEDFRIRLRAAMEEAFGTDGSYGVFVRSDTNVEDLPGFTGAGLNLTVPNVVGFDAVLKAVSDVWASPFSRRAFAWRQSHMADPEHVYPAILLLKSVPSEKSGVLVTQDIDTGSPDRISVAVNEGVGGAVEGQAAESLRIDLRTGDSLLLDQSTALTRAVIDRRGGVRKVTVSGGDTVLTPDEQDRLVTLARELPRRFPPVVDADGNPAPADIEFGFVEGKLRLFQIRPFLESSKAKGSRYLNQMDSNLRNTSEPVINLDAIPS